MLAHLPMKILFSLLFIVIITGCKLKPESNIYTAAFDVSGAFITKDVHSSLTLQIKGARTIKKIGNNTYRITGSVEESSSYNVPFGIERFSETVHYLGGDINDFKNWQCLEIYVGKKKIKISSRWFS